MYMYVFHLLMNSTCIYKPWVNCQCQEVTKHCRQVQSVVDAHRCPGLELIKTFHILLCWFCLHNHCDYTDVGNGALRTSSMADTLTGSCLFVPISSPVQQFLA